MRGSGVPLPRGEAAKSWDSCCFAGGMPFGPIDLTRRSLAREAGCCDESATRAHREMEPRSSHRSMPSPGYRQASTVSRHVRKRSSSTCSSRRLCRRRSERKSTEAHSPLQRRRRHPRLEAHPSALIESPTWRSRPDPSD